MKTIMVAVVDSLSTNCFGFTNFVMPLGFVYSLNPLTIDYGLISLVVTIVNVKLVLLSYSYIFHDSFATLNGSIRLRFIVIQGYDLLCYCSPPFIDIFNI